MTKELDQPALSADRLADAAAAQLCAIEPEPVPGLIVQLGQQLQLALNKRGYSNRK